MLISSKPGWPTAIAAAALFTASACGNQTGGASGNPIDASGAVTESRLIVARGEVLAQPVWFADGDQLVVTRQLMDDSGAEPAQITLASVDLETDGIGDIPIERDDVCTGTPLAPPGMSLVSPGVLPDGRLAFIVHCLAPGIANEDRTRLAALERDGSGASVIRDYGLPTFVGPFDFSQSGRGVINDGNRLEGQLAWLAESDLEPLELPFANAGYPIWRPDGSDFAVDAATEADSPTGSAPPRNLYLVDSSGTVQETILRGVEEPSRASWSPDGKLLALAATLDGVRGVYVLDPASGRLALLREGDTYNEVAWLPSGDQLVIATGVRAAPQGAADAGLEIITIAPDHLRELLDAGKADAEPTG